MKVRATAIPLAVFAGALVLVAAAAGAMVGVYRNSMETTSQRSQLVKLSGSSCARGGSQHTMRIAIGKRTRECSYRTPVLGRDLEVAATERLLSGTPKSLQRKMFLGLVLRAGRGARYQLVVYPLQQKVQLRKYLANGSIKYLAIEREVGAVQGVDKANQLRLSAVNASSGSEGGQCLLRAYVGGKLVAEATDPGAGELTGRASGVAIGSAQSSSGAIASVDDVVVRVPSPF